MEPSAAYKECWAWEKSSPNTIANNAKQRDKHPKIAARIAELKAEIMEEIKPSLIVTVESILEELEEARQVAIQGDNPNAMVSASMGKAKLSGLDKQVIEIQAAEELTPWAAISSGVDKNES
jgi:23S rRNA maturation-related 3'-5' exoribonuclease YhaM